MVSLLITSAEVEGVFFVVVFLANAQNVAKSSIHANHMKALRTFISITYMFLKFQSIIWVTGLCFLSDLITNHHIIKNKEKLN